MEEWKEYKLGEISDIQTGPFGSQLHQKDYVPLGTPCIMPTNIGNRLNIDTTNIAHVKGEDVTRLQRHCVKEGDIIYSRRGDIEKCAYILPVNEGWLCGTGCLRIRVKDNDVNSRFLAYQLSTCECKKWIVGNAVGSTMLNLNTSILKELPLRLPSKNKQDRLVNILKSLDDKIEVNRRINDNFYFAFFEVMLIWALTTLRNDNLEKQAQKIFDSMFPSITSGEDEIGSIITPKRGKGLLSKDAVDGDVPVIAGGLEPATFHNEANTKAPIVTISASGANAGFVNLWQIPVWSSDSSFIDSTMTEDVYFWYVMLKKRQKEIFDAQTGSAQPHIYPKHIAEMPLGKFEQTDVEKFTEIVTPMFEIRGRNLKESERLASIRDTLLPKLMSGELKLENVNV